MTKPIMVFQCRKLGGDAGGVAKLTIEACATSWKRANHPTAPGMVQPRGELKAIPSVACRGCAIGESHARDGKAANGVRLLPLAPHGTTAPTKPRMTEPERVMPAGPPPAPRSMTADSIIGRAASMRSRFQAAGAMPRYPQQILADLTVLVAEGHTIVSLAERTGIPANTIANACKKLGITPRRGKPPSSPEKQPAPAAATSAPTEEPASQDEPATVSVEHPDAPIELRTIMAIKLSEGREALVSFPKSVSPLDLATAGHALIGRSIMAVRDVESRRSQKGSKP